MIDFNDYSIEKYLVNIYDLFEETHVYDILFILAINYINKEFIVFENTDCQNLISNLKLNKTNLIRNKYIKNKPKFDISEYKEIHEKYFIRKLKTLIVLGYKLKIND